jgi:hypothetical protein
MGRAVACCHLVADASARGTVSATFGVMDEARLAIEQRDQLVSLDAHHGAG